MKKIFTPILALALIFSLAPAALANAATLPSTTLEYDEIAELVKTENLQMEIMRQSLIIPENAKEDMERAETGIGNQKMAFISAISTLSTIAKNTDNSDTKVIANATIAALQVSMSTLEGLDFDAIDQQVAQLNVQEDQLELTLINASQQLFVGYHQIKDAIAQTLLNRPLLEEDLRLAQVALDSQTGTALAVAEAKLALSEFDSSIRQMENQAAQMLPQLKMMVAWPQDLQFNLGAMPKPDINYANKIDTAADILLAQENSFAIKGYQIEMQYTSDKDADRISQLNIDSTMQTIAMAIDTQYLVIQDKLNTLTLEQERLTVAEAKIEQTRLQNELGLVPAIALQAEETALLTSQNNLKVANAELFWEIEYYKALIAGLDAGGMN